MFLAKATVTLTKFLADTNKWDLRIYFFYNIFSRLGTDYYAFNAFVKNVEQFLCFDT